MKCQRCGYILNDDYSFCPNCGIPVDGMSKETAAENGYQNNDFNNTYTDNGPTPTNRQAGNPYQNPYGQPPYGPPYGQPYGYYGQPPYGQPYPPMPAPMPPGTPKKVWFDHYRSNKANGVYNASKIVSIIAACFFILSCITTFFEIYTTSNDFTERKYYKEYLSGFSNLSTDDAFTVATVLTAIFLALFTAFLFAGCFKRKIGFSIALIPMSMFFAGIPVFGWFSICDGLGWMCMAAIAQTIFNGIINSEYNKAALFSNGFRQY